ncbi:MAG: hypothetical protein ACXWVQ_11850 [Methyloceanibacter sp.]
MPSRFIVFAAASLLLAVALPFATLAEDAAKPSAAQIADGQSKAGVANALIIIGRSAKDPDMLMAAAKLLAAIDAPVADPKASAGGKPVFYDVDAIVKEADGYVANRSAGKPASRTYQGFCHYEYLCDSLSCSYVWVC